MSDRYWFGPVLAVTFNVTGIAPRISGSMSSTRKPLFGSPTAAPPERAARTTSSVGEKGSLLPLPLKESRVPERFSRTSNWAAAGLGSVGMRTPRFGCVAMTAPGRPSEFTFRPDCWASRRDTVRSRMARVEWNSPLIRSPWLGSGKMRSS